MASSRIDTKVFRHYSDLVSDYISEKVELRSLVNSFFSIQDCIDYANNRSFAEQNRRTLVQALKTQYEAAGIMIEGKLSEQLTALGEANTFTVTTGHQLCMLTGPLYFVIKILHVLKMAETLNQSNSGKKFIPVFWMASEDHDFEEINHAHVFNDTLSWESKQSGMVGDFDTSELSGFLNDLDGILGDSEKAKELSVLFHRSYGSGKKLAEATRILVHALFEERGLVILDGNDKSLKEQFIPCMLKEVEEGILEKEQKKVIEKHWDNYKVQVNPRELNLFYLAKGSRDLIDRDGEGFKLKDGSKSWTLDELRSDIEQKPESFSPNVVFRPVYQEVILPNICYIGGGAEVAYWLQLKSSFDAFGISFPLINLRNSVLWLDASKQKKLAKLDMEVADLFMNEAEVNKKLADFENLDDSLDKDIHEVHTAFEKMAAKITGMDPTLKPYVLSEGKQIEKQLDQMKKKLLKARKAKNEERINSYWNLHEKVFPGGNLHERYDNFVPYFMRYGKDFFDRIYDSLDPEDSRLILISD